MAKTYKTKILLHETEKNEHFIICKILLPHNRKTIIVSNMNELQLLLEIIWPLLPLHWLRHN